MISSNNPRIDVDQLRQRVLAEVAQATDKPPLLMPSTPLNRLRRSREIERLLTTAEAFSRRREKLPERLNRFPLTLFPFIGRFLLRLHGLLLRDHRLALDSMVVALREMQRVNEELAESVDLLVKQAAENARHEAKDVEK